MLSRMTVAVSATVSATAATAHVHSASEGQIGGGDQRLPPTFQKNMASIIFQSNSIEREKNVVEMTRRQLDLIKMNRIRITWPASTVEEEYRRADYDDFCSQLEKRWAREAPHFLERLLAFFHEPLTKTFTVHISNYGPLGFYHAGDAAVTVNRQTHLDPVRTIKHELIHIMLEPYVREYQVDQARKEAIAESILGLLE